MMNLLKRNPLLSGILYEAIPHIIFWGIAVIGAQQYPNTGLAYYSIFLFPLFIAQAVVFPFIHHKMLTAGKGSRFAIGTLVSGIVINITVGLQSLFSPILRPLDWGGLIILYAWFILLGISILKLLIAGIQTLVYKRRSHTAPATESESPINENERGLS